MPHTRRHFLSGLVACSAMALFVPSASASVGAEDYVHRLGIEVIHLAAGGQRGDRGLQRRFGSLLARYINVPSVANFALGTARSSLPAADKAMFYELVANYAAALFVYYVKDFQGSDLKVTNVTEQGAFTIVDSQIVGSSQPVKWRVSGSDGALKIADINVQGVWLTIAMKDMFTRTLNASGGDFKPLYAKLREADTWQ